MSESRLVIEEHGRAIVVVFQEATIVDAWIIEQIAKDFEQLTDKGI